LLRFLPLLLLLLLQAIERGCQFVLLGSAPDPKVQAEFDALANELGHGQDAGFVFAYDEPLSHMIYAGADVILVPSMFEPCGLTQVCYKCYKLLLLMLHC
jgi:starch synthase